MSQILDDLNAFQDSLNASRTNHDDFQDDLGNRLRAIAGLLNDLSTQTDTLKGTSTTDDVGQLLAQETANWQAIVHECARKIAENVTGRDFQHRFEKQALVIVFGIVKAGKSTLGNFIRGRAFANAPFDNPYKHQDQFPISDITVEISGRPDALHKDYFDENSIESTCSAQYFTMPGLVWVDTPGTAALAKKNDIRILEDIARQFVMYADLVVFLANSASPGVSDDIRNYQSLYQNGKRALMLITRSDTTSKPTVVNGKVVKAIVAKAPERRRLQEESLCDALAEQGIPRQHISAVSISTRLAEMAIQQQDDQLWRDSNMGQLYRSIGDVISNQEILRLKLDNPRRQLNAAIDAIIGSPARLPHEGASLRRLADAMAAVRHTMQDHYDQLAPDGRLAADITQDAVNRLRAAIRHHIDEQADSNRQETVSISLHDLQDKITSTLQDVLQHQVQHLIGHYQVSAQAVFSTDAITATADRQHETHTSEVEVPYRCRREPEGLFEHIGSFFGMTYYDRGVRTERRSFDIDHGFDTTAAKAQILAQLEDEARRFVAAELAHIRDSFFLAGIRQLDTLIANVNGLTDRLNGLRFR